MKTLSDFLFQQTSLTLDESAINANLTSDNNTKNDDVVEVQNSPELTAPKPQIIPPPLAVPLAQGPLTTTVTILSEIINSFDEDFINFKANKVGGGFSRDLVETETETNEPSNNTPTGNFQPKSRAKILKVKALTAHRQTPATPPPAAIKLDKLKAVRKSSKNSTVWC
jgi:hypothetical protein